MQVNTIRCQYCAFETNQPSSQTKLTTHGGFGVNVVTEYPLLPDVKVQHKLSPMYMKTSSFCARSDVFLSVLGRENMTPLSAVALDNL